MRIIAVIILFMSLQVSAEPIPGDANGDGRFTMSDVVYSINYIFGGGPAPAICPEICADSCVVDSTVQTVVADDNRWNVDWNSRLDLCDAEWCNAMD